MHIVFEAECGLYDDPANCCVTWIKGYMMCIDDRTEEEYIVARSRMVLFDHGMAMGMREDPLIVLDSISGDVADFSTLYTSKGYLSSKKFGGEVIFNDSLLILDRLEVSYPFRGCNLGRVITQRAIRLYGPSVGLAVLMACPLQFGGERDPQQHMQYDLYPKNKSLARTALYKYYEEFGFTQMGRSSIFYLIPEDYLSDTSPYDCVEIPNSQQRIQKLLAIVPEGVPKY